MYICIFGRWTSFPIKCLSSVHFPQSIKHSYLLFLPSIQPNLYFFLTKPNQPNGFLFRPGPLTGICNFKKREKRKSQEDQNRKKIKLSEVYIQYHEINWKSLRWSDRFPQTESNFTILLSPNTKHFEAWAQKCLEDGMCTKDEEREPLQPDGNNKDVKVITTKITFVKVKVKLYHWKVKVKWYFKTKWSSGDKRTDRRFDKAGPGWWANPPD